MDTTKGDLNEHKSPDYESVIYTSVSRQPRDVNYVYH